MRTSLVILGLLILLCSAFAYESIYAGETLEKKLPEIELYEKGVIPDIPDIPGKYVTATVIDNTDYCLAYPNCYIILNVTSDILLIPTDIQATFKDSRGAEVSREVEYEHMVTKVRALDCPEYSTQEVSYEVFNNQTQQTETIYENVTTLEYVFCGLENYTTWEKGLPTIQAGDSAVIKILGHKKAQENIDVIPELYGISFNAWAWWNSTFQYKNPIVIENLNGALTNFQVLIEVDSSNFNMSNFASNFEDIRFTDSAETTEYSYWIQNYTAPNETARVWVNVTSLGAVSNTTIYMYHGNTSAVTSQSDYTAMDSVLCDGDTVSSSWSFVNSDYYCTPEGRFVIGNTTGTIMSNAVGASRAINCSYSLLTENEVSCSAGDRCKSSWVLEPGSSDTWPSSATDEAFMYDSDVGASYYFYQTGQTADASATDEVGYIWGNGWAEIWTDGTLFTNKSFTLTGANGLYGGYYSGGWNYGGSRPTFAGGFKLTIRDDENYENRISNFTCRAYAYLEPTYTVGAEETSSAPTLNLHELGPSTIYPYTPVWCAVNWTDDINTTFEVHLGLAINGTITDSFNQTNYAYSNGTLWNYTTFDVSAYGNNTNVSCWTWATDGIATSETNYTANITMNGTTFNWNNHTYTTPQYETVRYNYTANFTVPADTTAINYVYFHIHGVNFTPSCSNVSVVYYCTADNIEAPVTNTNASSETAYWLVNYTNGVTSVEQNETFTPTIYFGIWALNITSPEEAIEQIATTVNVTYGYETGIQGTVSGTTYLGTSSGAFSCSAGLCTASVTPPNVEVPTIYQTTANLTLTSPYWGETSTKEVWIEYNGTAFASSGACDGGGVSNCANAYDSDFNTYNNMYNLDDYINLTFSFPEAYYIDEWVTKRRYSAVTYWYNDSNIPEECLAKEPLFQVKNVQTDDFAFYCLNQSSETWITLDAVEFNGYQLYETEVNWSKNNSLTWVTPFGLTDCSSGVNLFNYSCRDEDSQALITCDYSQTFTVVSGAGTTYETFSGSAQEWDICFYPATLEANISSIEQYGATNYNTRFYYLFSVATGVTSYNQTIYLADDTNSTITFIYVKSAGVAVQNAYIYVQKYFVEEGTFKTVAWALTDSEGKGVTYLVPNDEFYRFVVMQGGEVTYTSETMQIGCALTYCTVNLEIQDTSTQFWDYYSGMASNCTFNNDTKIIACTFAVTDGTNHNFNLSVYRWERGEAVLNCTNSTTTSSGTLFCDIGDNSTTGRFAYALSVHSLPYFLQQGEINLNALAEWGDDGIIYAFLIIILFAGAFALAGPQSMALGAYIGVIISSALELLHLGLPALVGLGVVVAVFIYAFRN